MKERFLTGGLDGFSDHEVLELILFYAIPRRDVNELSHRLVETFGSFNGVIEAGIDDLCAVEGIGENSATLIKLISESYRRYSLDEGEKVFFYDDMKKIGDYAVKLYVGVAVEKLYAMLFDNRMKLIDTVLLAEGAVNSVRVSTRTICEKAIKKNASTIVLVHNHPNGTIYPSDEDVRLSSYLRDLLAAFDINLLDHVIVSGRFYRPVFASDKMGENKLAAPSGFKHGTNGAPTGIGLGEPDQVPELRLSESDKK